MATDKGQHGESIGWDTDEQSDLLRREGRIRDKVIYLTAALLSWMEKEWGGVVTHLKTSTDPVSGEVSVFRAHPDEPGAVRFRRIGAQNAGEFSFRRPLAKLGLKVPPYRQFSVTPFTRRVEEVGTLFVFPLNRRISLPRTRKRARAGQTEAEAEE